MPDFLHKLDAVGIALKTDVAGQHRLPCPRCKKGRRDDALAIKVDERGATWTCHRCGWSGCVSNGRARSFSERVRIASSPSRGLLEGVAKKTERASRLIERGQTICRSPADIYLRSRSIDADTISDIDPDALCFVPDAWHWPTQARLPAMVARIVTCETNATIGAHQTFLAPDGRGKAAIDRARLYLGPKTGGCVKLTPDSEVNSGLAVAEGIETALSGMAAGYPTWACLDAGNLAGFPVLDGIEALTVLADNDTNRRGREAAEQCARRWHSAGHEVRIIEPDRPGTDWNDVLKEVAVA